jgi:hypothetical protein
MKTEKKLISDGGEGAIRLTYNEDDGVEYLEEHGIENPFPYWVKMEFLCDGIICKPVVEGCGSSKDMAINTAKDNLLALQSEIPKAIKLLLQL